MVCLPQKIVHMVEALTISDLPLGTHDQCGSCQLGFYPVLDHQQVLPQQSSLSISFSHQLLDILILWLG
jgi:hypothetical protein